MMAERTKFVYVNARRLSGSQKRRIRELQRECFSKVNRKEIAECFIAKAFAWVFAYERNVIVGQIELFSRKVEFEGQKILLGGLGGTCVTGLARNRGVGSKLVREGIKILTGRKCDIACLNVNIKDYPSGGLYYRLGFRLMRRPVTFIDAHGKMRCDNGEMFAPICSNNVYKSVMNSQSTFHVGRGYW